MVGAVMQGLPAGPWESAADLVDKQGLNMALFGHPGCGKTTLSAGAQDTEYGRNVLFFDFGDAGVRSIADRKDIGVVDVKKRGGWEGFTKVSEYLKPRMGSSDRPIGTVVFDTVSGMQKIAIAKILTRDKTNPDMRGVYGEANDWIAKEIADWCTLSRETGVNVIFHAHAQEVQDEENKIHIRVNLTPGLVSTLLSTVNAVGFLTAPNSVAPRKLRLQPNAQVIAKFQQPLTGPQLPDVLEKPSMAALIEHVKGIKVYPVPQKKTEKKES